jgi:hypothetical protein
MLELRRSRQHKDHEHGILEETSCCSSMDSW